MSENKINCDHACKNSCATLEEAIKREKGLIELFESALSECNIPDIRSLMNAAIANTNKAIYELQQKLDEIHSASDILDDIDESYDKEGR